MNASIHRTGLAIAALAVIVTVGGFFVADGYLAARRTASSSLAVPAVSVTSSPSPAGSLPPEVVYVRPAPSPGVIHVTQTAPPAPPKIVHVTVPGAGGEAGDGEGGGEGGGGGD